MGTGDRSPELARKPAPELAPRPAPKPAPELAPTLVLASTSVHRRALLNRLGLPFSQVAPSVDETPLPAETPRDTAARLALAKARACAAGHPHAIVIGSDQVAELDGEPIGKPPDSAANVAQLLRASGREVIFHTGLAVIDTRSGAERCEVVPFAVCFRTLSAAQAEAYVAREPALDCAGGFRSEGLGVALFSAMSGEDPSALIGLPLIRLTSILGEFGVEVLRAPGP